MNRTLRCLLALGMVAVLAEADGVEARDSSVPGTGAGVLSAPNATGGSGGGVVDVTVPGSFTPSSVTPWRPVTQFLGASDGKPDGRGLTDTAYMSSGQCLSEPGCVMTPGSRTVDVNRRSLAADVAATLRGGGYVIVDVEGTVDNQHQTITADNSKLLARNRAERTARVLAGNRADMIRAIAGTAPRIEVLPRSAFEANAASCRQPNTVCVTFDAHPDVKSCDALKVGSCALDLGRIARARAQHFRPDLVCVPSATRRCPAPGGTGPGAGPGGVVGGGRPGSGGPGGPGALPGSPPGGVTAPDLGELLPGSVITPTGVHVRVQVVVPRVLQVGGSLRPQDLRVDSVSLMCGNRICGRPYEPTLSLLSARLDLEPSSSRYPRCATQFATNGCGFHVAPGQPQDLRAGGGSLSGGSLRAMFFSPTPPGVRLLPTLTVRTVDVFFYVPGWVGGERAECQAPVRRRPVEWTPPADCWGPVAVGPQRVPVLVETVGGEPFASSGDTHRLSRAVVGSVGAN